MDGWALGCWVVGVLGRIGGQEGNTGQLQFRTRLRRERRRCKTKKKKKKKLTSGLSPGPIQSVTTIQIDEKLNDDRLTLRNGSDGGTEPRERDGCQYPEHRVVGHVVGVFVYLSVPSAMDDVLRCHCHAV